MAAMEERDLETSLKVIIVGNGQVGKTSMVNRFARGVMTDNYKKTIGTDFMEKEITVKSSGEIVKLMLWDTAGQEMFAQLTRQYYQGAGAVVFVFSTTDRDSFLEIERWKQKVDDECGDICAVLVQNKIDLLDQAVVTSAEVENLARRLGLKLYRVSVKDNVLVDDLFDDLSDSYLKRGEPSSELPDIKTLGSSGGSKAGQAAPSETAGESAGGVAAAAGSPSSGANPAFTLGGGSAAGPSKQRTGGKKKPKCIVM